MEIKAVLFDLDDTLVVEEASAEDAFLATCRRASEQYGIDSADLCRTVRRNARKLWKASPTIEYCRTIGISSWEGLWARFNGENPDLSALRAWALDYRRGTWSSALMEHGIDDVRFAELLADIFQRERRSRHILFPDTESTLERLRRRYRLGLVTNGVPDLQHEMIQGANLAGYFESITISGVVGVSKPDPEIFRTALNDLGVEPQDVAMIGNSLASDIAGAQNSGIKAVWITRSGVLPDKDIVPDALITSLSELPGLLEGLVLRQET